MTTPLSDTDKLEAIYHLAKEAHDAVIRLEKTNGDKADTLQKIEVNTGLMARFTQEQLESVTRLAAGKNQVPVAVFIAFLVIGGAYAIAVTLKDANMDVKIPWLGIEVHSQKHSSDKAGE
ncbi:MAG: hypothetical protein E6R03_09760 [Hyphomicrobiaceae bacterium]|nr:MAG: hypothetical protein E6R03_09760 [Hyphomicrobiaceae bacterium]